MKEYKVVYDNGKPYEVRYHSYEELYEGLKKFYYENINTDYGFNATIYDEDGNDISDLYIIEHTIGEIIDEYEEDHKNETN